MPLPLRQAAAAGLRHLADDGAAGLDARGVRACPRAGLCQELAPPCHLKEAAEDGQACPAYPPPVY